MKIWSELKTRKIFKAATIYAAVTWGLIQIADVLFPVVGVAEWVMSSLVLLAFAGFPIALIVGWMLDIRIEKQFIKNGEQGPNSTLGSRIAEIAVIGLFGIGAALLYYNSANEPVNASVAKTSDFDRIVSPGNDQKTIAVLPFANFSDSSQDEYFADGLAEELLNVLARNKRLRVAARTSAFQYKNTNINVKTIARELGVDYILEGSVRRSGDIIRVTAQLIQADEDRHIFSKSWDRDISNVFEVQDEISNSVLDELKVSLLGEVASPADETGTNNIAAFAEYSKGLSAIRNRTKADFDLAIESFTKALSIDPNYSEAAALLAEAYLLQVSYGFLEFEEAIKLAEPLVAKALNQNPKLAQAHAVKGLMLWQHSAKDKNNETLMVEAKHHLSKAIDLNPSLAEAYMWYGSILQDEGQFVEGAKFRAKAFQIDPQAAVVGYNRAKDLVHLGDYEGAMNVFNTVVRNNPNYPNAYTIAGDVSYRVGQLDQAYGMYSRHAELGEDEKAWLINASRIYIPIGRFQLAQENYDKLIEQLPQDYQEKFDWLQASIWIASGDYESFYQWAESFNENTSDWGELLWRGFSWFRQNKLDYASDDLKRALSLIKQKSPQRVDENTIRIQVFLAGVHGLQGDQVGFESYLSAAQDEIEYLKNQGFASQEIRYFEATIAILKGNEEKSLALLRQSIQEGFVDFWWVDADPIFDEVRTKAAFKSIRDEYDIRMQLMRTRIESQYGRLALNSQ